MPAMTKKDELPIVPFESPKAWEVWLGKHHASSAGVWLKIAKKESGVPSVTYAEALDVALCYGWIDGQKGSADDGFWLQRFTPRKPRSNSHRLATPGILSKAKAERMRSKRTDSKALKSPSATRR